VNNFRPLFASFLRCSVLSMVGLVLLLLLSPVASADLVYQPVNPSFGGNPLNSNHLLGIAGAQNDYSAPKPAAGTSSAGGTAAQTANQKLAAQFMAQIQSRLVSSLASQVAGAIFGDNPQDSGTVVFGDQTIAFERGLDAIKISITDAISGDVTAISVPVLVTGL
jgi:curli production assembly/transport component CsgF